MTKWSYAPVSSIVIIAPWSVGGGVGTLCVQPRVNNTTDSVARTVAKPRNLVRLQRPKRTRHVSEPGTPRPCHFDWQFDLRVLSRHANVIHPRSLSNTVEAVTSPARPLKPVNNPVMFHGRFRVVLVDLVGVEPTSDIGLARFTWINLNERV